jgi:deazaflavin-dependent oxidoreductase (nitroreductase family)
MTKQASTLSVGPDSAEQRLFRTLNRFIEPAVRAGLGSSLAGPGAYVVETTGHRSGLPRRVPLLAKRVGDSILVSTIRDDSQWIRNLEHHPYADVWIAGRPRRAAATVVRLPGATIARLRLQPSSPPDHPQPEGADQ